MENDTEFFKRVLLSSEDDAKSPSRFFRAIVLLIAVILAALAVFWVRRTFVEHATGKQLRPQRAQVRAVTVSDNPQSTLLGLLRSSELGDPSSQLTLASLYQSGETVQKDDAKAAYWLREAAIHGEKEAAYRLGNAFRTGQGVPVSKIDAYCWYVLAAQAGHNASEQQVKELTSQLSDAEIAAVRYQLGQMSLRGVGIKADPVTAYFWFQLAEAAGHPGAKQAKQELQSRMNVEQLETASEKAARWLQAHPPTRTNGGQAIANQR
jgi:TPR repeat protein